MNRFHRFAVATGLVLLSGVVSLVAAASLPEHLVTTWDATGEPAGTMPRTHALWLAPVLGGVLVVLFAVLPRIDPLRENVTEFRPYYDWLIVVFAAFMLVLHVGIVAFNLGYEFRFTSLIVAACALLFYYAGIVLEHAKRNWFVGIRTPWTLSSDVVWNRTHQLGARLFKASAVLGVVGLAFGEYAMYFLLVSTLLTALVTIVYSYYLYGELEKTDERNLVEP